MPQIPKAIGRQYRARKRCARKMHHIKQTRYQRPRPPTGFVDSGSGGSSSGAAGANIDGRGAPSVGGERPPISCPAAMRRSMVHHIKQPRQARPLISNGRDALQYRMAETPPNIKWQRCPPISKATTTTKQSASRRSDFLLFRVGYANIHSLHSGSHNWDSPWPATPGLKAPASLPTGVNCIPFRKNCWSPQPKVPAAISVENRWLPRAHRELVFSSRGRRHEARPVSNFRRFRGRPPLALAC